MYWQLAGYCMYWVHQRKEQKAEGVAVEEGLCFFLSCHSRRKEKEVRILAPICPFSAPKSSYLVQNKENPAEDRPENFCERPVF